MIKLCTDDAQKLRLGLHKLNREELRVLCKLVGFNQFFIESKGDDDLITEVMERIDYCMNS